MLSLTFYREVRFSILFLLLFSGCNNTIYRNAIDHDGLEENLTIGTADNKIFPRKNLPIHHVELISPVINASVLLYDINMDKVVYRTQTDNTNGTWQVPLKSLIGREWIKILVIGGFSAGDLMENSLCAIVPSSRLKEENITVDVVSTLICDEVKTRNDLLKLPDIKQQSPFNRTSLSDILFTAKIGEVFFDGISLSQWKKNDADNDGFANWDELLMGMNPVSVDSDGDGLRDDEEINNYGTSAIESDSDGDYIPDAVEIAQNLDPLNSDENNNMVLDGLEGDPFSYYQWYLNNPQSRCICTTSEVKTIAGNDLNIFPLYHKTLGSNHGATIVQVVDGGVDSEHSDLCISLKHSLNSITGSHDPCPTEGVSSNPIQIFYRGHGTAVAGIIGAKGLNGIGVRGVAPDIVLAGSNWLESQDIDKLEAVWYMAEGSNDIAISNNSWGARYIDDKSFEYLMEAASEDLRNGKGRIFVFASGNDRKSHGNANLSYLINNPYAIAVSALNHKDKYASYSTPGSNILVSAYGGEHYYDAPTIMTTFSTSLSMYQDDLAGRKGPITIDEDTEKSYTYAMNGTSAAAPMVSGALALVLDMCPSLTWRDVRWLIAQTAVKVDVNNSKWVKNAAGLWHNNNYGFGKINASGMVDKCMAFEYKYLPEQKETIGEYNLAQPIPDTNQSIEIPLKIERDLIIEWVGITVKIEHPYAGDIDIELVSPSGTVSHIIEPNFLKSNTYGEGFRFSSVSFLGEKSRGVWVVRIRDALVKDEGILKSIKLKIKGYE